MSENIDKKSFVEEDDNNVIKVVGARVHNLKNIDVIIPRDQLTVITGLSGSGKSSLAFDTIYAEGQRRYIETFSAYARNFIGGLERPDVDDIQGLSPVISIEQKTVNKNPRSTVGTVTEIYDFLRLLFARASTAFSFVTGEKMVKYSDEQILTLMLNDYKNVPVYIMAPVVRARKGHYRELFDNLRRKGFLNVRVDGEFMPITMGMKVDRYKNHNIEVVVDKLLPDNKDSDRLIKSIAKAMDIGNGMLMIMRKDNQVSKFYSRKLMCPTSGISYSEPAPNNFSFNSPEGWCPRCKGLGVVGIIDQNKIIPDRALSVSQGALAPLGKLRKTMIFWQIEAVLEKHGFDLDTPVCKMTDEAVNDIMFGNDERICISKNKIKTNTDLFCVYEGLPKYIHQLEEAEESATVQRWAESFDTICVCPQCKGQRLKQESLHYRFNGLNIAEVADIEIAKLYEWTQQLKDNVDKRAWTIAEEIVKEINKRLKFLLDVGLDYLTLNRASASLSGGENQRIRLATQIGSQLVNVLYILDEPSIGLHQRDNERLINSLKELRDIGNTVIVVEHDRDIMKKADYIVDIGPRAGRKGGQVMFQGTPQQLLKTDTITAKWLRREERMNDAYRKNWRMESNNKLTIRGMRGNNLKNIDIDFPLGKFICVTGVSGSGKSTIVNETLQPILSQHFYRSLKQPLEYDSFEGIEYVDKVVCVDQAPIGKTPRSNPATYTGVFNDIRNLFVELPEAKMRAYKPGRFSFNVKGGRCEACSGNGYKNVVMNFLPDIQVKCEVCHGQRYNRPTLEVKFKGKSIADVLDMTINQAVEFFENQPNILHKIEVLQQVGLGYIKLGQSSTTLSGGESQRVKLATELAKRDTGKTVFILDEPTTGLHFADIQALLDVLHKLVEKGNTVIVIEHNLDVIVNADYIIDIGPEGGIRGGELIVTGTPQEVARSGIGITSRFIRQELEEIENINHE
jgi:excinuclease ABC subunit A